MGDNKTELENNLEKIILFSEKLSKRLDSFLKAKDKIKFEKKFKNIKNLIIEIENIKEVIGNDNSIFSKYLNQLIKIKTLNIVEYINEIENDDIKKEKEKKIKKLINVSTFILKNKDLNTKKKN